MEKRRIRPILTISIEPELRERIKRQAEEADLSVSRYVEQALMGGLSPRELVDKTIAETQRIMRKLLQEHEERTRGLVQEACDQIVSRVRISLADMGESKEKRTQIKTLLEAVLGDGKRKEGNNLP